jgi:hypothetical protein
MSFQIEILSDGRWNAFKEVRHNIASFPASMYVRQQHGNEHNCANRREEDFVFVRVDSERPESF